jgi:RNA polymerase sigma factor (sigma-70 family)
MADDQSGPTTRPSLLVRLQNAHDTVSWQAFVNTYAPLVYGYYRKRGLQAADAADLSQEVLARVARAMQTFVYQPDRGRFRDWLGTVTRHQLATFLARKERGDRVANLEGDEIASLPAPEADSEWTADFNARLLEVALVAIRPIFEAATWAIFEEVWQHDRPALDVARALEVPIEKVYAAKARVLKRLREELLLLAEDILE